MLGRKHRQQPLELRVESISVLLLDNVVVAAGTAFLGRQRCVGGAVKGRGDGFCDGFAWFPRGGAEFGCWFGSLGNDWFGDGLWESGRSRWAWGV